MATNTAQVVPPARQDARQVPNTLKKTVNFNDTGISSGLAFDNSLPLGAFITRVLVEIVTAFNAVTTNVLTVGTNSTTYNDIVAAADVNEGVAGVTEVTRGYGRSLAATADKTPYAKYTQTGTAATTGQAVIVIEYEGGWSS
jgi:hypothetical protein